MKLTRQDIHEYLVKFKKNPSCCEFFSRKSPIRTCLESLRGNLDQHAKDGYKHMPDELNSTEMTQLINGIMTFVATVKDISNVSNLDNYMVFALMCQSLLWYEFNNPNKDDAYRKTVNAYFYALNKKLNLFDSKTEITPLTIWLQHFIDHPEIYIGHRFTYGHGNSYNFNMLDLSECGCVDISHDRIFSDLRLQTEQRIIAECKKRNLENPKLPIKILSFGTGKGLQDFLIVLKLFNLGIRNIELTFIERDYQFLLNPQERFVRNFNEKWQVDDKLPLQYLQFGQRQLYSLTSALSLLTRSYSDSKLIISHFDSVRLLKEDKRHLESYDIIHAIDLDDYDEMKSESYKDFHSLSDCLSSSGVAMVSSHYKIHELNVIRNDHASEFKLVHTTQHDKTEPEFKDHKIYYHHKHSMQSFTKLSRI